MKIIPSAQLPEDFFTYRDTIALDEVRNIISNVSTRGDKALREYTRLFDRVELDNFVVSQSTLGKALEAADPTFLTALEKAAENLRIFARAQRAQLQDFESEIKEGVVAGQRIIPIDKVGVYVPGGAFPLVSTLLMGVIPAQVAGVSEIVICSPPSHQGEIHPNILAAAALLGIQKIYRVGGAQAIAALAHGTETLEAVDKIVGPGNKYVAQAKKEVFGRVGIDLIAGPTEVLILADEFANPVWLAADLLAQAEHDLDASAVLLTTSKKLAQAVQKEIKGQLKDLATRKIAESSITENGLIVLIDSLAEAVQIINKRAPEHLELQVKDPEKIGSDLRNFGSLFIGETTAEVLGDYSSGINHTLPTNTTGRYRGGLSVHDFLKIHTTLRVDEKGLAEIGPVAEQLARAEGLDGHRRSVRKRLEKKG